MYSDNLQGGHGFFSHGNDQNQNRRGDEQSKPKPKVFVPVTLKMIDDA